MPTPITGLRTFESFLSISSAQSTEQTQEIDFQLGPEMGIEVMEVNGIWLFLRPETIASSILATTAMSTLHAQVGALEDVPLSSTDDDETRLDSEVIHWMGASLINFKDDTNGNGSVSYVVHNGGLVKPQTPILAVNNLTHKITPAASMTWSVKLIGRYRYVRFSREELGVLLSRRR